MADLARKRKPSLSTETSQLVRGALRGGLPVGSFRIAVENGHPVLLPTSASGPLPSAEDAEDAWDRALGLR